MPTYQSVVTEFRNIRERQRELAAIPNPNDAELSELIRLEGQADALFDLSTDLHDEELQRRGSSGGVYLVGGGTDPNALYADEKVKLYGKGQRLTPTYDSGLGALVFGAATGQWDTAPESVRNNLVGGSGSGSYVVPIELSRQVIDLARAKSVCFEAGAILADMAEAQVKIPRIAADPTVTWKAQGTALTPSDPTLNQLTLNAKTLTASFGVSQELFEDGGDRLDAVIQKCLAGAFAAELDRVALVGATGGQNPVGIAATSGINTVPSTSIANYAEISEAIFSVWADDFIPNAVVMAPRSAYQLDTTLTPVETSGSRPFQVPPRSWASITPYITSAIPINLGTGTDKSEIIVGDFTQLVIGVRTNLNIMVSPFPDSNLDRIVTAWMRCDVGLYDPTAFCLISGVAASAS